MQTNYCAVVMVMVWSSVVLGMLGAAVAVGAGPATQPLKVFVLAGQSNMVGSVGPAGIAQLQGEYKLPLPSALVFDGKTWIPLEPGKTQVTLGNPPPKGFGPEIGFAHAMSKTMGEPFGIIKYAVGGTNLAKDWSLTNTKSLYFKLLDLVKAARASRDIEIVGMLWVQGERDSRDEAMAKAYARNLDNFIARARQDFQSPAMMFIAARVNPRYPYVELVRKGLMDCKADRYAWVDCDDLPKAADHLHYTGEGQLELGRRFAQTVGKMLGTEAKDAAGQGR